jgi:uncharacterized integral membrane protein
MRLFRRRPTGPIEDWQPRLYAIIIGLVLIVAYVIAFIVKNDDQIDIDFVLFTATVSLIWAMIFVLVLGVLSGVLLSQIYRRRGRQGGRET